MGFLVPAFLAGILAIGIPIWVHLTNKQRKEAVEFPSLMFLEKIPFRSEQKQVIRNVLLFALRVLALLLLIAAFARPFVGRTSSPVALPGSAREVVVLVDRSYSMAYGDRWDRALEAAREAIDGLSGQDQGSVVLFDERATVLGEPTSDKASLKALLASAKVGDRATKYPPALKMAQEILYNSELPRLEVVLISDFQKVGWEGHEEVQLPRGTEIRTVDLSSEDFQNLAVTSVVINRDAQQGRDRFTASARVSNSSSEPRRSVPVSLNINGRVVETKRVDIPPQDAASVMFASVAIPEGTTRGTVSLEKDELPADDSFHFVVSGDQEVGVLVLEDDTPVTNQSFFLRGALGIGDRPRFRVEVRSVSRATFGDLDRKKLVILNDAPFPSGDMGRRLKEFVAQGGGLFIVVGEQSQASGWTGDAAELFPGGVGNRVQRGPGNGAALASLDYGHPILEIFSAPRSGDFSGVRFFSFHPIRPDDSTRTIAHFDDGSVAIAEKPFGKGRVVAFGAALDGAETRTDFPRHVVFLPFIHQVAKHVASFSDARPWFNVGDVLDVVLHAQTAAVARGNTDSITLGDVALIAPSGDQAGNPGAGVEQPSGFVELEERGFYEVRTAGGRLNAIPVAVNVDLSESDLSRFEPVELVAAVSNRGTGAAGGGDSRTLTAKEREKRQNLWWYLLLLALLLMAAETLLGNRLSPALRRRTS